MSLTGIRLHYSNRTERLLEALIGNLEASRARGVTLFDPSYVVVPNRNVETYVKFGIAGATGIAANLNVPFLRSFLGQVVQKARPNARIVDGRLLQGLVLSLLYDEELLAHEELRPVREYIQAGGKDPDAIELRRSQLAAQVAHFFEEYGYSRQEMLDAWPRARVFDGDFAETEGWQRRLWLALFSPSGLVERRASAAGEQWFTAAALFQDLRPDELQVRGEIHFFGISYVARAYQSIFSALARSAPLNIYTVNPCMEFWEDVETEGERMRRKLPRRGERLGGARLEGSDDPFLLNEGSDTPILRLWGRPGRENIRLLNELTECEFEPSFEDPTATEITLLRQLQRDILVREPEREEPDPKLRFDNDHSVTVLSCSGVRREAEAIASEIWALVKADEKARATDDKAPRLRFNDIAVILPGKRASEYQAHLAAVLRETWDIPHNIVDMAMVGESRVAEAVELLLALPFGRFTRQEMLRLATHPSVMARFSEAESEDWLGWCESLGIVHGADHRDHSETYITRDVLNWDQGLRRLALGSFMTGRKSGDARMLALGGELYPPEEPRSGIGSAAGFGVLVRSLIEDARACRTQSLPMAQWIQFLQKLVGSYVVSSSEDDERALGRCLRAIQALEEVDLGGRAVPYRIPYELVKGALASVSSGRGQHLADGVVVSSFLPMRAIPFRVIFVAGLGERDFPSVERADRLDLRTARRRPGDVSPREQDKYMFLETLLCARDRFYLSYISRNELTGDRLEPSSVIRELRHLLDRGYLGAGGYQRLVREEKLRRFDPAYFLIQPTGALATKAHLAPEARREAEARALGEDLREHVGSGAPAIDLPSLRAALPEAEWSRLANHLGLCPPQARPVAPSGILETVSLSISTLRRFLECPLQGSAGSRIGLREESEGEDLLAREDELFETGRLEEIGLLRSVFVRAIGNCCSAAELPAALEHAYEEQALALELDGKMPTGLFGEVERTVHLQILGEWRKLVEAWTGGDLGSIKTFRFGRAEAHTRVDELLDPVVIEEVALADGRRVRVEITGQTQPVLEKLKGSLVLVNRKGNDKYKRQKDALRGFVDHVILSAAGRATDAAHQSLVAHFAPGDGGEAYVERFHPIAQEEARRWLGALAADLLGQVHDYLLPVDAVFSFRDQADVPIAEVVAALLDNSRSTISSDYGPVPQPRGYAVPEPERASEMIERRFGLYYRTRHGLEAKGD